MYMTFEEILNKYKSEYQDVVCEAPAYLLEKKQGEFTVKDYYNIPDNLRVELIDGVIYYMAAPTSVHQIITLKIGAMLEACHVMRTRLESKGCTARRILLLRCCLHLPGKRILA